VEFWKARYTHPDLTTGTQAKRRGRTAELAAFGEEGGTDFEETCCRPLKRLRRDKQSDFEETAKKTGTQAGRPLKSEREEGAPHSKRLAGSKNGLKRERGAEEPCWIRTG